MSLIFLGFLLFSSLGFSQQIKINIDYANSQIRSKRVELGLEVNKGVNFNGNVKISFGDFSLLCIKIKSAPALEYSSALLIASFNPFPKMKLSTLAIIKKSSDTQAFFAVLILVEKFLIVS